MRCFQKKGEPKFIVCYRISLDKKKKKATSEHLSSRKRGDLSPWSRAQVRAAPKALSWLPARRPSPFCLQPAPAAPTRRGPPRHGEAPLAPRTCPHCSSSPSEAPFFPSPVSGRPRGAALPEVPPATAAGAGRRPSGEGDTAAPWAGGGERLPPRPRRPHLPAAPAGSG